MRIALRVPSGRRRGTRNMPRPRVPSPWPGTRARVRITSAPGLDANHFLPVSVQCAPWSVATVSVRPTSVPPCFSVMNIAPVARSPGSVEESAAISAAYRSGSNRRRIRAAESVIERGQAMPNSDCT